METRAVVWKCVPEEAERERGLAGAGAAHDAELVARRHGARDVAQRGLGAGAVGQRQLLQLQRARLRPRGARALRHAPRRFLCTSINVMFYSSPFQIPPD